MRVIVFGSRTFTDNFIVDQQLEWCLDLAIGIGEDLVEVVQGGAKGADLSAYNWAKGGSPRPELSVIPVTYKAEWDVHDPDWCKGDCVGSKKGRPFCSVAGFKRNQQMADDGAMYAFGFVDKPVKDSRGSFDMWKRCKEAEITTYLIRTS